MTMPSIVVAAIVSQLAATLGPAVNEVRAHDGVFGAEGKEKFVISDPGVLVTCVAGAMDEDGQYLPKTIDAVFAVYVLARNRNPDGRSRGGVAADLAVLIGAIVQGNDWGKSAVKLPERIRVTNEHTEALVGKGLNVWSVFWTQRLEISQDVTAEISRLGRLNFTFALSDSVLTPREEALIVYPETTP
jgi:phage gp37-like protein